MLTTFCGTPASQNIGAIDMQMNPKYRKSKFNLYSTGFEE